MRADLDRRHEPRRIILLGPPGAGKGTQADVIASRLDVSHISTGEIFRANVDAATILGLQAQSYMDSGAMVPDELTTKMVSRRLNEDDVVDGFLLDGFPRNLNQAEFLDEASRTTGNTVDLVLELHMPAEEVVQRLNGRLVCGHCGRSWHAQLNTTRVDGICDTCAGPLHQRDDDREDSIRRRLELYEQQTTPLLTYYREQGKLVPVDALGPIGTVNDRLLAALDAHAKTDTTARR